MRRHKITIFIDEELHVDCIKKMATEGLNSGQRLSFQIILNELLEQWRAGTARVKRPPKPS